MLNPHSCKKLTHFFQQDITCVHPSIHFWYSLIPDLGVTGVFLSLSQLSWGEVRVILGSTCKKTYRKVPSPDSNQNLLLWGRSAEHCDSMTPTAVFWNVLFSPYVIIKDCFGQLYLWTVIHLQKMLDFQLNNQTKQHCEVALNSQNYVWNVPFHKKIEIIMRL